MGFYSASLLEPITVCFIMSLIPDNSICVVCMRKVLDSDKGLQCENICERWFHAFCVNVPDPEYRRLASDGNRKWTCARFDCTELNKHPLNNLQSKFDTISMQMAAIITKLDDLSSITKDISSIKSQLVQVNEKLSNIEPRITDSENRIKSLEDEVLGLKNCKESGSNVESVLEEINDRERRSRNVIIYNLPESASSTISVRIDHDKNLISKLTNVLCTTNPVTIFKSYRIGRSSKNKIRPLKVIFKDSGCVMDFCKNFDQKSLPDLDPNLKNVSVSRDRTPNERKHLFDLRAALKDRTESGETDLTIKYINGTPKIVKQTPKND